MAKIKLTTQAAIAGSAAVGTVEIYTNSSTKRIATLDDAGVTVNYGTVAGDTIWQAAGDLIYGTGSGTAARLPKGTDGYVLTSGSAPFWSLSSSGHTIANSGSSLPTRTILNFQGSGVTASDNSGSGRTDVTIGGTLPTFDNSTIKADLVAWNKFHPMLDESVAAGKIFTTDVITTYTLKYTVAGAYAGGVLAPNGDIHFVPCYAAMGQKIDSTGLVSTYTLKYTVAGAYQGGVVAPNGDIHFVPYSATMGQKIMTMPAKPFSLGLCCSPYFNKL